MEQSYQAVYQISKLNFYHILWVNWLTHNHLPNPIKCKPANIQIIYTTIKLLTTSALNYWVLQIL